MPDWCRDRATDKLFYRDRALLVAEARVIEVVFDVVILDRTVFYPEGGGQQGDRGWLTSHAGPLRVRDTQKRGGMLVARTDLPVVMVDTEVLHFVEGDASRLLRSGDEVEMNVDGASRAAGSRRHSAVHLLSGMFQRIGADSDPSFALTGFHITADDAWIDVAGDCAVGERLRDVEGAINRWIDSDAPVDIRPVDDVPDVYTWDVPLLHEPFLRQACGGMHVSHLREIGRVRLELEHIDGVQRVRLVPDASAG